MKTHIPEMELINGLQEDLRSLDGTLEAWSSMEILETLALREIWESFGLGILWG